MTVEGRKTRARRGRGMVVASANLIAISMLCLGAVGIREGLVSAGKVKGSLWIAPALDWFDRLRPQQWWVLAVSIGIGVIGLALVISACMPRPKPWLALRGHVGVFLFSKGCESIAKSAVETLGGVLESRVRFKRRRISIGVKTTNESDELSNEVRSTVEKVLGSLDVPPKVRVRTRAEGGGK